MQRMSVLHRQADGRKVLRSSIREFLCSEAIFFLGLPTTRAGSVVTSDSRVIRDVYYSGNPRQERCSVVLRIAPTFLRWVSSARADFAAPLSCVTVPRASSDARVLFCVQVWVIWNLQAGWWVYRSSGSQLWAWWDSWSDDGLCHWDVLPWDPAELPRPCG